MKDFPRPQDMGEQREKFEYAFTAHLPYRMLITKALNA